MPNKHRVLVQTSVPAVISPPFKTWYAMFFVPQAAKVLKLKARLPVNDDFPLYIKAPAWYDMLKRTGIASDNEKFRRAGEESLWSQDTLITLAAWFYENTTETGQRRHRTPTTPSEAALVVAQAFLQDFVPQIIYHHEGSDDE